MSCDKREKLATRLGFIMLSAGCAIGIGNVWRFPYVTGQSGGGWFVLIYLVCLALIGLPVLLMEFACGRAAQRSIATLHAVLTPGKSAWRLHGLVGNLGLWLLMMFYTVVTGWMATYFCKSVRGDFAGLNPEQVGAQFGALLGDPWVQALAMLGICASATLICGIGLQKGVERVTKVMMVSLLAIIVVLAANSLLLDGAMAGVRFYLVPSFERMRAVGIPTVIGNAMNHAFFTLSLGIGSMAIFGSYIDKKRTLLKEGITVATLDTFVALMAGLIIIPACFAFDLEAGQGPGLVFVTLPNVFNHMPGGRAWGSLFFLFMTFAAFSTVIAVFEGIIAGAMEYTHWSRRKVCAALAVALPLLSLPCALGFNLWSGFQPLGPKTCVLDLEDFLVSDLALPLGGLAFALYCTHRFGWGWERFLAEVNAGEGARLPDGLRFYCAWILPVLVGGIIAVSLIHRFAPTWMN